MAFITYLSCVPGSTGVDLWGLQFLHAGSHSVLLPACNHQPGLRHQGTYTHTHTHTQ